MKDGVFLSKESIKSILAFTTNGDYRKGLDGVWLDPTDPKNPVVEATDGHRMHRVRLGSDCMSPDTDDIIGTQLRKKSPSVTLTQSETNDLIFKLREIAAVIKVYRKRSGDWHKVIVKFTNKSILITARERIIVRYVKPEGGIHEKLIGMKFAVNMKYALEAFEMFHNRDTNIKVTDELSPVVIKNANDDDMVHLLMPMRLERMS